MLCVFLGTTAEVYEALRELGYGSFRPGQEAAIMRILSGRKTRRCEATATSYYLLITSFLNSSSFRPVHPGGSVHRDGKILVLPAPSLHVRQEIQMHHFGDITSGVADG